MSSQNPSSTAQSPTGQSPTPQSPTPLRRVLGLFTQIEDREEGTALLLCANVFLLLCAYYFIKPLREGWISVSGLGDLSKMEIKAYTSFAQSLVLLGVVRAYGKLSDRYTRSALVVRSTLFCMSNLVLFWFAQPDFFFSTLPGSGFVFYLWVGMFSVFVVSQFWAYAADLYNDDRGRRLLPLVAIGATGGAASGSWIVDRVVSSGLITSEYLLVAALVPLGLSLWITHKVDQRGPLGDGPEMSDEEAARAQASESSAPAEPEERRGGLSLVWSTKLLFALAAVTLLLNWVNTNGENVLFRVIQDAVAADAVSAGITDESELLSFTRDQTTAFYGNFFFWVNIAALALQAFVASRLLRFGGLAAVMLLLPVVALVSYTAMFFLPMLAIIKPMKIAENAIDYSINNTARSVVWLPLPDSVTYKGKTTIDTLFTRVGDGMAALTVLVGVRVLDASTAAFCGFTVVLVLLFLFGAFRVVREHKAYTAGA